MSESTFSVKEREAGSTNTNPQEESAVKSHENKSFVGRNIRNGLGSSKDAICICVTV